MDMRGYSESEKPSGITPYRMEKLVEDVEELVYYLGLHLHPVCKVWK